MSDEILCSINGADDICDFHLQREVIFQTSKLCSIFFFLLQLADHCSEFDFFAIACGQKGNIVYPHWQVIGHPLQLLDTLA